MAEYKYSVNIFFLLLLCFFITCNTGKRISREKLTRLLGQNAAMGLRHANVGLREKTTSGNKWDWDINHKCIFLKVVLSR